MRPGHLAIVSLSILAVPVIAQRGGECVRVAQVELDPRIAADQLTSQVAEAANADGRRRAVTPGSESAIIDEEIFGATKSAGIASEKR